MIVTIKIEINKNKYEALTSSEMSIDSDVIDAESISILVQGIVRSAFTRAEDKLKKESMEEPQ